MKKILLMLALVMCFSQVSQATITTSKTITKVNLGTEEEPSYVYNIKYKITNSETEEVRIEAKGNFTIADIEDRITEYTSIKSDWEDNKDIAEAL